jgi:four helix bundle protein
MENREFAKEFEKRTMKFAISILKLSAQLPYSVEAKVIRNQLSKSGTSIGANYHEANRGRSKADFSSRIKIAESEASETIYWLEIVQEMEWITDSKLVDIMKEANELLAIFTSISKTLKS